MPSLSPKKASNKDASGFNENTDRQRLKKENPPKKLKINFN